MYGGWSICSYSKDLIRFWERLAKWGLEISCSNKTPDVRSSLRNHEFSETILYKVILTRIWKIPMRKLKFWIVALNGNLFIHGMNLEQGGGSNQCPWPFYRSSLKALIHPRTLLPLMAVGPYTSLTCRWVFAVEIFIAVKQGILERISQPTVWSIVCLILKISA